MLQNMQLPARKPARAETEEHQHIPMIRASEQRKGCQTRWIRTDVAEASSMRWTLSRNDTKMGLSSALTGSEICVGSEAVD